MPQVARPSQEASQLQVRLLGALQAKLRLKLGLAVLRQASALNRLRLQLLSALAGSERDRRAALSLAGWHAAAVSLPVQVQAADTLRMRWLRCCQRHQLHDWRRWAAHRTWQRRQVALGLAAYHRSLLSAALRHWQAYCQGRHLERLCRALASRWLSGWTSRRALTAWRQAAQRSAQLKRALLGGNAAADRPVLARPPPPTLPQALAVTRAAFQSVKSLICEAAAQLRVLQSNLRFATGACKDTTQLPLQKRSLGSLESLLVLTALPRATQQVPHHADSPPPAPALEPLAACSEAPQLGSPAAAPDPGSPAYCPAQYTSPARLVPGDAAVAVEAELLDCQQAVATLALELAALEQVRPFECICGWFCM